MTQQRVRYLSAFAAALVVSSLSYGCAPGPAGAPVSLPVPRPGDVTFYLSLPSAPVAGLYAAASSAAIPGSSEYRHVSSLDQAAHQFGATDTQINTVAASIAILGLQFAADPTRLFARVTGSTSQWQAASGVPLSVQPGTASSPFITYSLPASTPPALQPAGTSLLLPDTEVYDPTTESRRATGGNSPRALVPQATTATPTAKPWPVDSGTPLSAACSSPLFQERRVYTPQQVRTAYGSTPYATIRPTPR
jgi:hypothetical protein